MKLTELEPKFLKLCDPEGKSFDTRAGFQDNDGLWLLCPVCFKANSGPVGTHGIICWKPHVPQTIQPTPGRWSQTGSGFDDLTLVAASSSVLVIGGCNAHFFIRNGEIV